MNRMTPFVIITLALAGSALAQTSSPREEKRGWFGRILHPFHSSSAPDYKDPRLRGLLLELQLSPQPVKLSEVRQLEVKVTLSNLSKRPVALEFSTAQRIEIELKNSVGDVLTRWSDNHAFAEEPGNILVNPQEHIDYSETIATRDLAPNKVFIAEVYFPKYPELRVRQKFLTAP